MVTSPFLKFGQNFYGGFAQGAADLPISILDLLGQHETARQWEKTVQENFPAEESWGKFLGQVGGSILPTLPVLFLKGSQLALKTPQLLRAAKSASLTTYGVQSAGHGRRDVRMFEEETGQDVSGLREALTSIGYGAITLASEQYGLDRLMKNINQVKPIHFYRLGHELGKKQPNTEAVSRLIKHIGKSAFRETLDEGTQEFTEELSQNIASKLLYDSDRNVLEGTGRAFLAGAVAGGAFQGIGMARDYKHLYSGYKFSSVEKEPVNILDKAVSFRLAGGGEPSYVANFVTPSKKFIGWWGTMGRGDEQVGAHVKRFSVDTSQFFDPDDTGQVQMLYNELQKDPSYREMNQSFNNFNKLLKGGNSWMAIEGKKEELKRLGFKGAKMREIGEVTYMILDNSVTNLTPFKSDIEAFQKRKGLEEETIKRAKELYPVITPEQAAKTYGFILPNGEIIDIGIEPMNFHAGAAEKINQKKGDPDPLSTSFSRGLIRYDGESGILELRGEPSLEQYQSIYDMINNDTKPYTIDMYGSTRIRKYVPHDFLKVDPTDSPNKAIDKIRGFFKNVARRVRPEEEYQAEKNQRLIDTIKGLKKILPEATNLAYDKGFILPDGTPLTLRGTDFLIHAEAVAKVRGIDTTKITDMYDALNETLYDGIVRFDGHGAIEIWAKPTRDQLDTIFDILSYASGSFAVELVDPSDRTADKFISVMKGEDIDYVLERIEDFYSGRRKSKRERFQQKAKKKGKAGIVERFLKYFPATKNMMNDRGFILPNGVATGTSKYGTSHPTMARVIKYDREVSYEEHISMVGMAEYFDDMYSMMEEDKVIRYDGKNGIIQLISRPNSRQVDTILDYLYKSKQSVIVEVMINIDGDYGTLYNVFYRPGEDDPIDIIDDINRKFDRIGSEQYQTKKGKNIIDAARKVLKPVKNLGASRGFVLPTGEAVGIDFGDEGDPFSIIEQHYDMAYEIAELMEPGKFAKWSHESDKRNPVDYVYENNFVRYDSIGGIETSTRLNADQIDTLGEIMLRSGVPFHIDAIGKDGTLMSFRFNKESDVDPYKVLGEVNKWFDNEARLRGEKYQIGPVYHGTARKFDKPELRFVGTGQGAQAQGYGHYVTTDPNFVPNYYASLAAMANDLPFKIKINGKDITESKEWTEEHFNILYHAAMAAFNHRAEEGIIDKDEVIDGLNEQLIEQRHFIEHTTNRLDSVRSMSMEEFMRVFVFPREESAVVDGDVLDIATEIFHHTKDGSTYIRMPDDPNLWKNNRSHEVKTTEQLRDEYISLLEESIVEDQEKTKAINRVIQVLWNSDSADFLETVERGRTEVTRGRYMYKATLFKGKDPSEYQIYEYYNVIPQELMNRVTEELERRSLPNADILKLEGDLGILFDFIYNKPNLLRNVFIGDAEEMLPDTPIDSIIEMVKISLHGWSPSDRKEIVERIEKIEEGINSVFSLLSSRGLFDTEEEFMSLSLNDIVSYANINLLQQFNRELRNTTLARARSSYQDVYMALSTVLGGDVDATKFMVDIGVNGVVYPGGATGTGGRRARSYDNYVIYTPEDITIEEWVKEDFQRQHDMTMEEMDETAWRTGAGRYLLASQDTVDRLRFHVQSSGIVDDIVQIRDEATWQKMIETRVEEGMVEPGTQLMAIYQPDFNRIILGPRVYTNTIGHELFHAFTNLFGENDNLIQRGYVAMRNMGFSDPVEALSDAVGDYFYHRNLPDRIRRFIKNFVSGSYVHWSREYGLDGRQIARMINKLMADEGSIVNVGLPEEKPEFYEEATKILERVGAIPKATETTEQFLMRIKPLTDILSPLYMPKYYKKGRWGQVLREANEILTNPNKKMEVIEHIRKVYTRPQDVTPVTAIIWDAVINRAELDALKEIMTSENDPLIDRKITSLKYVFEQNRKRFLRPESIAGYMLQYYSKNLSITNLMNALSKLSKEVQKSIAQEVYQAISTQDVKEMEKALKKIAGRIQKATKEVSGMDLVYAAYYNSMLSNPATQLVNMGTNYLWGLFQLPHTALTGFIEAVGEKVGLVKDRGTYSREILPMFLGTKQGKTAEQSIRGLGKKAFKYILKYGSLDLAIASEESKRGKSDQLLVTLDLLGALDSDRFNIELGTSVSQAFEHAALKYGKGTGKAKVASWLATLGSMPTRLLRAVDVWSKTIALDRYISAKAYNLVRKQGLPTNLWKQVALAIFKGDVVKLRELGVSGASEAVRKISDDAAKFANYSTFMDAPGLVTDRFRNLRNAVPGAVFFMPFINTVANIAKRGLEMTPGVGVAFRQYQSYQYNRSGERGGFSDKRKAAIKRPDTVAEMLAKQIEGAVIAAILMGLLDQDKVTVGAPRNPAERERFYAQGKLPWAFKAGNIWVQYRDVEPLSTVFATIGIAYNAMKETEDEKARTEIFQEAASNLYDFLAESTWISGIEQLMSDHGAERQIARIPATLVPFSAAFYAIKRAIEGNMTGGYTILESPDTFAEGVIDNLRRVDIADAFVDPLAGPAEKKIGLWGKEVKIPGGLFRQWLPWKWSEATHDPVEEALARLGYYPGQPRNVITVNRKEIELPDDLYRDYRIYFGSIAKPMVERVIRHPRFHRVPAEIQMRMVDRSLNRAREIARSRLVREIARNHRDLLFQKLPERPKFQGSRSVA